MGIVCGSISGPLADDPTFAKALYDELSVIQKGRAAFAKNYAGPDFIDAWIEFAGLFDILRRPAFAFFWKNYFLDMRNGHIDYGDAYHGPDFVAASKRDDGDGSIDEAPF